MGFMNVLMPPMKKIVVGETNSSAIIYSIEHVCTERATHSIVYFSKMTSQCRVILVTRNCADMQHDQPLNILTGTLFPTSILMMRL